MNDRDAHERPDRHGFDANRSYLSAAVGRVVPESVVRRALRVDVETDRERYAPGDPIEFTVTFHNRLPVPVSVPTPRRRLWGWTLDGDLEASDEPRYSGVEPSSFPFRANERKVFRHTWNGLRKRVGERTRWRPLAPGTYELTAFVATDDPRPSAATTVRIEAD
ncbi:hypothetical protein BRC94_12595 [Halobacteriales archaeon QS_5_70_17]|nr:MAG: hypothetical protein BRC94_12595 [Halobacteriales archaeon QS_5_70_17]